MEKDFCANSKIIGIKESSGPKNHGQKRNWSAFGAEHVRVRVSKHFESDLQTLKERGKRNSLARRRASTLCRDHAGSSHD